jgi:aspartate 4-decarboxylase
LLAAAPREAFFLLGEFALAEARHAGAGQGWGVRRDGVAVRLDEFIDRQPATAGSAFLRDAIGYGARLAFDPDAWVFELATAALGSAPAQRARMLSHCESVVHAFFVECLGAAVPHNGRFEITAMPGNGASWGYVAQTMVTNRLLSAGDLVAIGGARRPAGMDLPNLGVYGLHTVDIVSDRIEDGFPDAAIEKLADPAIKAFFVVSPAGGARTTYIERLASVVRGERPDLLVLADESLASLADGSRSFAAVLPGSVVSTYSFATHFGAAGWRLEIVALHSTNAFDLALAELPPRVSQRLARRYQRVGLDWSPAGFIDRVAAESGCLAMPSAGGLATPQQAQATLFALFGLLGFGRAPAVALAATAAQPDAPRRRTRFSRALRPRRGE